MSVRTCPLRRTVLTILLTGLLTGLLTAMLACDGGRLDRHAYNGYRLSKPMPKPDIVWQRPDGTPFDVSRETAGRVTLLYFGYTHCPDVCPMQLMNLATALRTLGPDTTAALRVLFVTLDPVRDTSSVLRQWLAAIHPAFIALRGPLATVNAAVARLDLTAKAGADTQASSIGPAHASAVVAFGRDGLAHFIYPENTNPKAWAYDLRKLLRDSVP